MLKRQRVPVMAVFISPVDVLPPHRNARTQHRRWFIVGGLPLGFAAS